MTVLVNETRGESNRIGPPNGNFSFVGFRYSIHGKSPKGKL